MRITKKEFVNAIESLQLQNEQDAAISSLLSKAFPNAFGAGLFPQNDIIQNGMIALLEDLMNDKGEWIKYFIVELDFGKEAYRLKVYHINREHILSDAGKLYDFILHYF